MNHDHKCMMCKVKSHVDDANQHAVSTETRQQQKKTTQKNKNKKKQKTPKPQLVIFHFS